ncbi:hypothetical protein NXX77_26330 [Phocaeicola dorei]|nr:hypothetical protein [Bacteroides faecis]MCS3155766.1 hypothetical protein [Phocaeicola dorei]UVR66644.1 hypothetical protein NXW26_07635 [Bacteroides faecis]
MTVACCPATFPGVWPHFGTLCPQVGAKDEGRGLSYTCRRSLKTGRFFAHSHSQKFSLFFLPEQTGCKKHRTPFPLSATPAGITHYTLQAKSCAKGGTPLETLDNKTGGMLPSPGAYRRLLSAARFTVCV